MTGLAGVLEVERGVLGGNLCFGVSRFSKAVWRGIFEFERDFIR